MIVLLWSREMKDFKCNFSIKCLKTVKLETRSTDPITEPASTLSQSPFGLLVGELGSILQLIFVLQVLMKSTEKTGRPVEEDVFSRENEQH